MRRRKMDEPMRDENNAPRCLRKEQAGVSDVTQYQIGLNTQHAQPLWTSTQVRKHAVTYGSLDLFEGQFCLFEAPTTPTK